MYIQNENTTKNSTFVSKINPKPDPKNETEVKAYQTIERLAAIEHDQWHFWSQSISRDLNEMIAAVNVMNAMLLKSDKDYAGSKVNKNAKKLIEKHNERYERWQTQWNSAYTQLPEEVKESDRVWAKKAYMATKEGSK